MWLRKELIVLVVLEACIFHIFAIRVDTKKPISNQGNPYLEEDFRAEASNSKDSFNPGHAQHGGWRKPESSLSFEPSPDGNQWHAGDLSAFSSEKDSPTPSRISEGHGTSYNPAPSIVKPGQQYSSFSGGSLNSGGDLIVGQGSVQRPANAATQYNSPPGYTQGSGSFPVQAHIGPGTSQYSQVISSGGKKPAFSASDPQDYSQYSSGPTAYRPTPAKPQQFPQFGNKVGSYSGQGQQFPGLQPSFSQSPSQGNKYPLKPAKRPGIPQHPGQLVSSKPIATKPDVYYSQAGSRFPPQNSPPFPSRGGTKYPVSTSKFPAQPVQYSSPGQGIPSFGGQKKPYLRS